jgi:DNA-binding XRE family transcriptional regulator
MTNEPAVVSDGSRSPLDEAIDDPKLRLAWDNDVRFHVSRNLVHLRRYREMSQATLAKTIGTSQSAIARIESGEENVTETTVERIITALDGRFMVSIAPAEYPVWAPPNHLWWQMKVPSSPWTVRHRELKETAIEQYVRITYSREFRQNTLPSAANIVIEPAKAS